MHNRCSICGALLWNIVGHHCPPEYWCWVSDPDYDMEKEEGMRIWCYGGPDQAAAEYVERWESEGDYICIGGDTIRVSVVDGGEPTEIYVFDVTGETMPQYHAERVTV